MYISLASILRTTQPATKIAREFTVVALPSEQIPAERRAYTSGLLIADVLSSSLSTIVEKKLFLECIGCLLSVSTRDLCRVSVFLGQKGPWNPPVASVSSTFPQESSYYI